MKLEQKEKALLFSETAIPDIFFSEHLSEIPGDYLKIYLYMVFLSKYNKDVKVNDLSKKLNLPVKAITDGVKFLEDHYLIIKKNNGFGVKTFVHKFTKSAIFSSNCHTSPFAPLP